MDESPTHEVEKEEEEKMHTSETTNSNRQV
jgi:hypothetical protein